MKYLEKLVKKGAYKMSDLDEKSDGTNQTPEFLNTVSDFVSKTKDFLDNIGKPTTDNPVKLKRQLDSSRDIIERQMKLMKRWTSMPTSNAYIIRADTTNTEEKIKLLVDGRIRNVLSPENKKFKDGQCVEIFQQTLQIIGESESIPLGPVATISKLLNPDQCELKYRNESFVVQRGIFAEKNAGLKLEIGGRVVVDPSITIILANLGKEESKFKLAQIPTVTWDDIVGQDKAKASLKEAVELPYLNADKFKRHKKKQITGIMLLGPPGNGKSMLVHASASALAKIHGDDALNSGYHLINGPDVLEKYVGDGEKEIRDVFSAGEDHFVKHKYPAIIAIEEPDAVFIKRGTGKSSDVERALVTTLLTQMNNTHSIIILATNRPDILDPALVRAKRINKNEYIGGPDQKSAAIVMERNLSGAPLTGSAEELGRYAAAEIFSGNRALYEINRKNADPYKFTYANLMSYAEVADLAEKATSITFRRDVANNTDTTTGKDEIFQAINESFEEKLHLDHTDALRAVIKSFGEDFAGIKELRQSKK